ncbi:MAG TPA: DUF4190 domain-containing protein [Acetivibrio sp.]|nr:DUF4190 domain-containing protein [Acetivibrio sp.]
MKLCPKCGYSNEDFSNVCGSCGSPLNDGAEMPDQQFNQFNTYGSANMPIQAKTSGFAITSLVLGIVAVPFICCCTYLSIALGIAAAIFGFLAKNEIKSSNGLKKGNGMALAGIILGFVSAAISLILIIYLLAFQDETVSNLNQFFNEFLQEMEEQSN